MLILCARASVILPPGWFLLDNPKSKIFQYLKGLVQPDSPPSLETVIADGMFLIRSIRRCRTYRLFVHFDVYESPSLKDSKRQ